MIAITGTALSLENILLVAKTCNSQSVCIAPALLSIMALAVYESKYKPWGKGQMLSGFLQFVGIDLKSWLISPRGLCGDCSSGGVNGCV